MKRLSRLPALIVYLGVMNFLLFIIFTLLLGGDGPNGKIEAGHYYLGSHGTYTEVMYPIYFFSRVQGILFFVSWPFVLVASLMLWGGVGSERDDEVMRAHCLGRAFDLAEGFFSLLFDAWRKPDLEIFTRLSPAACVQEILTLPDWIVRDTLKRRALNLTWGGNHFELSRGNWSAWKGGAPIVLHGRLCSTSHGTYIKAWYRWSAESLLFFSVFAMFGVAFPLAAIEWLIVPALGISQSAAVEFFAPIWPIWSRLSFVIGLLLLIAFSGWWGRHRRRELALIVKENLTPDSIAHPTPPDRDIRQLT